MTVDHHTKYPSSQLVLFQQSTKIEDGGFDWNRLQPLLSKLARRGYFELRLFSRRIAVAKSVLH